MLLSLLKSKKTREKEIMDALNKAIEQFNAEMKIKVEKQIKVNYQKGFIVGAWVGVIVGVVATMVVTKNDY